MLNFLTHVFVATEKMFYLFEEEYYEKISPRNAKENNLMEQFKEKI